MPGFFAINWGYQIESWYYVGHCVDAAGVAYTFNLIFGRVAFAGQAPSPQMAYLGVGLGSDGSGNYYATTGFGLSVSDDPQRPAALLVPPVGDYAYDVLFKSTIGAANARARWTGGEAVGLKGGLYQIDVEALSADKTPLTVSLQLRDDQGTMLEGASGCVAPPDPTASGVFTYEAGQPRLTVTGGSLSIAGQPVPIVDGCLWHDKQVYNLSPYAPKSETGADTAPSTPDALIQAGAAKASSLYCGMWIALKFDTGQSMLVSPQWSPRPKGQQWLSGRAVGQPPAGGYGNLFLAAGADRYNGGALLLALGPDGSDDGWDYDVNLFDPGDPANSPHWTGPSGNTYATKWSIAFTDRLAQWGVPPMVYIDAVTQGCENSLAGSNPFWEGAVRIYSDEACTNQIGWGFAEQMGYN
jgi:predicted secreted hydrolase